MSGLNLKTGLLLLGAISSFVAVSEMKLPLSKKQKKWSGTIGNEPFIMMFRHYRENGHTFIKCSLSAKHIDKQVHMDICQKMSTIIKNPNDGKEVLACLESVGKTYNLEFRLEM